ncbi:hypothetical protein LB456_04535 [Psychroflexus sp. CAK57W]|nr:hypothetical protein [Psychroflexus curvus]MBZ9786715.1 hypothetical protein [Psychroflexus curvus]MBZ9786717.1 hypothetical protein [Psychroflexus curvus]
MKRLALRGGTAFVVFKDIKISLVPKALGIGSPDSYRDWAMQTDVGGS